MKGGLALPLKMTVKKQTRGAVIRYEGHGALIEWNPRSGDLLLVKNLADWHLPARLDRESELLELLNADLELELSPTERPSHGLCCDASVEGSGFGHCEIRVATLEGEVLFERAIGVRSANFGELAGIREALRLCGERGESVVWTDSEVARTWLFKGPSAKVAHADDVLRLLRAIWSGWPRGVQVARWSTRRFGEIPADFARKKGAKAGQVQVAKRELQVENPQSETRNRNSAIPNSPAPPAVQESASSGAVVFRLVEFVPGPNPREEAEPAASPPSTFCFADAGDIEAALTRWAAQGWDLAGTHPQDGGRAFYIFRMRRWC